MIVKGFVIIDDKGQRWGFFESEQVAMSMVSHSLTPKLTTAVFTVAKAELHIDYTQGPLWTIQHKGEIK